jgi:hypothetical protein
VAELKTPSYRLGTQSILGRRLSAAPKRRLMLGGGVVLVLVRVRGTPTATATTSTTLRTRRISTRTRRVLLLMNWLRELAQSRSHSIAKSGDGRLHLRFCGHLIHRILHLLKVHWKKVSLKER